MLHKRKGAFTLIELLIVVAIIAILALIAVPNFLEAQTRAKVSRAKADLRSLATAMEAYYVDNNSYTWMQNGDGNPWRSGVWGGMRQLTTPISYITTIPLDPFGETKFEGEWRPAALEMGTGIAGRSSSGFAPWRGGSPPFDGMPSSIWEIESDGPDHDDNTRGNLSTSSFPWPSVNMDSESVVAQVSALEYDPTNGTISGGEVYRCGGMKPGGRGWEVFFRNGSE
jgi:prepilin-type N-terminal cleavage/methylation domain-containing protein